MTVPVNRSAIIARLSALPGFAPMVDALNSLSDQQLANLDATAIQAASQAPVQAPASAPVSVDPANTVPPASNSVSITPEEHAELQAYRAAQAERKAALVTSLAASQQAFSAQDLQAMDVSALEKLAQLSSVNANANANAGTSTFVVPPVPATGSPSGQRASRKLPDSWGLEAAKNKTGTGAAN